MKTRRQFLKQFALAMPASLLGTALPAWGAQPDSRVRRLRLCGFERHQGRALWPVMQAGDPLQLKPSPRDESVAGSVAVYWGEFLIGHLPEPECAAIEACLQRGFALRAEIAALCEPAPARRDLILTVWMPR